MHHFPGFRVVSGLGTWGVILFFLLSGYLLAEYFWHPKPRRPLGPFYARRVARIAPAYYVHVAVVFLLLANPDRLWSRQGAVQVLHNLTFTQGFNPRTASSLNVSGALWTLSLEAALYAVLPVLALAIARRPVRVGTALLALGIGYRVLVTTAAGGWLGELWFGSASRVAEASRRGFLRKQFLGMLPLFVMGMLLRWYVVHRRTARYAAPRQPYSAGVQLLFLVPSLLFLALPLQGKGYEDPVQFVLYDLALALLLLPALAYAGRTLATHAETSTLSGVLSWLGRRSYGLYLWHYAVILVVYERGFRLRPAELGHLPLRLAVVAAVTLALASASYAYVERPALRWARHRQDAGQASPERLR